MTLSLDVAWPTDLPLPSIEYGAGPINATLVSSPKLIATLRRSRFTKSYSQLAVTWMLTSAQYVAFKTFFRDTLGNGVAWFPLELRYPMNSALTTWVVQFAGALSVTYMEGLWQVQARIQLINEVDI